MLVLEPSLANFVRLAGVGGHKLLYYPASRTDIDRDRDIQRRDRTLAQLQQDTKLEGAPSSPQTRPKHPRMMHVTTTSFMRLNVQPFMPLAQSSSLAERFPAHLAEVLRALDVDAGFVAAQAAAMGEVQYAKTSNRSVLGIMNQFSYLAEGYREYLDTSDLLELSLKLANVPCSLLYKRETFPVRELHRWINESRSLN